MFATLFDEKADAVIRQVCSHFPAVSPLIVASLTRVYLPLTFTTAQAVYACETRLRDALAY